MKKPRYGATSLPLLALAVGEKFARVGAWTKQILQLGWLRTSAIPFTRLCSQPLQHRCTCLQLLQQLLHLLTASCWVSTALLAEPHTTVPCCLNHAATCRPWLLHGWCPPTAPPPAPLHSTPLHSTIPTLKTMSFSCIQATASTWWMLSTAPGP